MTPFRWGIIGPGSIAREFANDLQFCEEKGQRITGVLSHEIEGAKEFAREYGLDFYTDDPERFVNDGLFDAVYIASPHTAHYEQTLLCLQHRKPVLCEKPLCINAGQAREMVIAASTNQCFLMEGMWIRFLPSIKQVLETIQKDTIGNIVSISANMSYRAPYDPHNRYFDPSLGGGSLLDLGIYPVYLTQLLLGRPESLHATGRRSDQGIDESCGMFLQYASGQYALLESSLITQTNLTATIYGDKGYIKIGSNWNEKPSSLDVHLYEGEKQQLPCEWEGRGFQFEIDEAVKCIRAGKIASDMMSHETSVALMETLDTAREQMAVQYQQEPYE